MPMNNFSPRFSRNPKVWLWRRFALVGGLVALADWLFFGEASPGVALAVFLAALGLVVLVANPVRAATPLRKIAGCALALSLVALAEDISFLSVSLAIATLLAFALTMTMQRRPSWPQLGFYALQLPFVGFFWLIGDIMRVKILAYRLGIKTSWRGQWIGWIVPIVLFTVFLAFFAWANPIIEAWMKLIDPRKLSALASDWRVAFWIGMTGLVWPLVHLRRQRVAARRAKRSLAAVTEKTGDLFGEAAILRAIILFNALFACETFLDITYLWGGARLPDGLAYAAYAHRGAFPLIGAALVAAAFVLIAMRPDGPARHSRWITPLVLVWVGQTIMLVVSAIFRNGLYIQAYSLSELRLAALIWMALVACGLIAIVFQIVAQKSNAWLLDVNILCLWITLLACCFVNFPAIVAHYNVSTSAEMGGGGPALDTHYLLRLGPGVTPALDAYLAKFPDDKCLNLALSTKALNASIGNWRAWTFRRWRLNQYLATRPWPRTYDPSACQSQN